MFAGMSFLAINSSKVSTKKSKIIGGKTNFVKTKTATL